MLFNRTANRGTPTKDNPVPSVKFCGIRYSKMANGLCFTW